MHLTQELGKEIVAAAITEYELLAGMWQRLEHKAQITIATAGVFLAAIFAFVRNLEESSGFEKMLLVVATSLLLLTILTASRVLSLKTIDRIPSSLQMADWADKLITAKRSGSEIEKLWDYYTNQAAQWQAASISIEEKYDEKRKDLETAQSLLIGALFSVCLTGIYNIF